MATKTTRRPARTKSPAKQAELELRKATIETAAEAVGSDEPDFAAFLARFGDRYSENNLRRLWVQCPGATILHKLETWLKMGRVPRRGTKAILLRIPRTGHDDDAVTPENPTGEVFKGAPWTALFDFSQTRAVDEDETETFTEKAPADADPDLVAKVAQLRQEAVKLHPDTNPGDEFAKERFVVAWTLYEARKAEMDGDAEARAKAWKYHENAKSKLAEALAKAAGAVS